MIFDSLPFRLPHYFWNFDHLPVNSDLETNKKELCPHNTDLKLKPLNLYSNQVRKETYLAWIRHECKSSFQLKCSYVSCRRNSSNLSGVQLRSLKSAKKDSWMKLLARKFYELHTSSVTLPCSKDFVASHLKRYIH